LQTLSYGLLLQIQHYAKPDRFSFGNSSAPHMATPIRCFERA